jgi:two-component system, OmpR family, response regulator ResD
VGHTFSPDQTDTINSATVLVVDDEESIRKLVCMYLQMSGFRTVEAASGDEALHLYGSRRTDSI